MLFMYQTTIFCTNCSKTTQVNALGLYVERGLPHLNINIVYSKVIQALPIILTNQCDMSKVKTSNYNLEQTMTWLNEH